MNFIWRPREGEYMKTTTGFKVRTAIFVALAIAIAALPGPAQAAPLSGTFTTVGTGNVRVGDSWIDWGHSGLVFESTTYPGCDPGPSPGCVINGTTTGDILFTGGTGSFSSLLLDPGTFKDLEDDFAPVNATFSLPDYIGNPDGFSFTATFIPLGTGTPAGCTSVPGAVCTPPGSGFTLTNLADSDGDGTADNVAVAFVIRGTVTDPSGPPSMFEGRYSTQLGMSSAEALAAIAAVGYVESSHSADFQVSIIPTVIPEPATLLTFGAGTALLAAHRRRRAKKTRV
jgi:hypothetical protein